MHIVLYSAKDWGAPDTAFDPDANRITRVKGTLAELVDRIVERNPETVFISGFEQNGDLIGQIEALRIAMPRISVIPHCPHPSENFLLRLMRSGVREVLTDDTPAAITELLDRAHGRQQGANSVKIHRTRRIAFMAAKGGDGCTCVAANFAAALARDPNARILIIDLSLPFGDLEMYLTNLPSTHDLADFTDEIERLDSALLYSMVRRLSDTLHVIPSPPSFDRIIRIAPDHVARLIDIVAGFYNYVLIDVGAGLDPITLHVLEKVDQLVVVGTLTLPSVRRTNLILRLWESLGFSPALISLVINRINSKSQMQPHEVERVIGRGISRTLPDEPKWVQESLLRGKPTLDLNLHSAFSEAILNWTAELSGTPPRGKSLWQRLGIK